MAEYTKEQFRKQVQVGIDYAVESELDEEQMVAYLTDHLWGTIGMLLHVLKSEEGKVHYYNEAAMADYEQRLDIRADEHANGEL